MFIKSQKINGYVLLLLLFLLFRVSRKVIIKFVKILPLLMISYSNSEQQPFESCDAVVAAGFNGEGDYLIRQSDGTVAVQKCNELCEY